MAPLGRTVLAAAVVAALGALSARAQQRELQAVTPLAPRAGAQVAPGVSFDDELAMASTAVDRMREVLSRLLAHLEEARAARDVIELDCVNEKLRPVRGLLRISEAGGAQLREAVASRDAEAASREVDKITLAQRKCEQLLAESEGCIGELSAYAGDTVTESRAEGLADEDPTASTGDRPYLERPPSASPYQ